MHLRHAPFLALVLLTLAVVALAACGISGADKNTSPPTSAGWPLTLVTDHAQYAPSDSLKVSVTNHQSTAVYALDTQASCSVLSLQELVNGQWHGTSAAPCAMKRIAMPVTIAPGATYSADIRAGLTDKSTATFPAGTYRLVLIYYSAPDDHTNGTPVYSAQFTITVTGSGSGSTGSSSVPSGASQPGSPQKP